MLQLKHIIYMLNNVGPSFDLLWDTSRNPAMYGQMVGIWPYTPHTADRTDCEIHQVLLRVDEVGFNKLDIRFDTLDIGVRHLKLN